MQTNSKIEDQITRIRDNADVCSQEYGDKVGINNELTLQEIQHPIDSSVLRNSCSSTHNADSTRTDESVYEEEELCMSSPVQIESQEENGHLLKKQSTKTDFSSLPPPVTDHRYSSTSEKGVSVLSINGRQTSSIISPKSAASHPQVSSLSSPDYKLGADSSKLVLLPSTNPNLGQSTSHFNNSTNSAVVEGMGNDIHLSFNRRPFSSFLGNLSSFRSSTDSSWRPITDADPSTFFQNGPRSSSDSFTATTSGGDDLLGTEDTNLTSLSSSLLQQLTAAAAAVGGSIEDDEDDDRAVSAAALESRRERYPPPPLGKLDEPELYGINLTIGGELVSSSDVSIWEFPDMEKLHDLRDRLVTFMRDNHLKQADICRFTGLGAPYLSFMVKDPTISNFSSRRRVEVYSVLKAFFQKIDNKIVTLEDIAKLVLLSKATARAANSRRRGAAAKFGTVRRGIGNSSPTAAAATGAGQPQVNVPAKPPVIRRRRRGRPRTTIDGFDRVTKDEEFNLGDFLSTPVINNEPFFDALRSSKISNYAGLQDSYGLSMDSSRRRRGRGRGRGISRGDSCSVVGGGEEPDGLMGSSLCNEDDLRQRWTTLSHGSTGTGSIHYNGGSIRNTLDEQTSHDITTDPASAVTSLIPLLGQCGLSARLNEVTELLHQSQHILCPQQQQQHQHQQHGILQRLLLPRSTVHNIEDDCHPPIKQKETNQEIDDNWQSQIFNVLIQNLMSQQLHPPQHHDLQQHSVINRIDDPIKCSPGNESISGEDHHMNEIMIHQHKSSYPEGNHIWDKKKSCPKSVQPPFNHPSCHPNSITIPEDHLIHSSHDDVIDNTLTQSMCHPIGLKEGDINLCSLSRPPPPTYSLLAAQSPTTVLSKSCNQYIHDELLLSSSSSSTKTLLEESLKGASQHLSENKALTTLLSTLLNDQNKKDTHPVLHTPFHTTRQHHELPIHFGVGWWKEVDIGLAAGLVRKIHRDFSDATSSTRPSTDDESDESSLTLPLPRSGKVCAIRVKWQYGQRSGDEDVVWDMAETGSAIDTFIETYIRELYLPNIPIGEQLLLSFRTQLNSARSFDVMFTAVCDHLLGRLHYRHAKHLPGITRKIIIDCYHENIRMIDAVTWNLTNPVEDIKAFLRSSIRDMNLPSSFLSVLFPSFIRAVSREKLKFIHECSEIMMHNIRTEIIDQQHASDFKFNRYKRPNIVHTTSITTEQFPVKEKTIENTNPNKRLRIDTDKENHCVSVNVTQQKTLPVRLVNEEEEEEEDEDDLEDDDVEDEDVEDEDVEDEDVENEDVENEDVEDELEDDDVEDELEDVHREDTNKTMISIQTDEKIIFSTESNNQDNILQINKKNDNKQSIQVNIPLDIHTISDKMKDNHHNNGYTQHSNYHYHSDIIPKKSFFPLTLKPSQIVVPDRPIVPLKLNHTHDVTTEDSVTTESINGFISPSSVRTKTPICGSGNGRVWANCQATETPISLRSISPPTAASADPNAVSLLDKLDSSGPLILRTTTTGPISSAALCNVLTHDTGTFFSRNMNEEETVEEEHPINIHLSRSSRLNRSRRSTGGGNNTDYGALCT